MTRSGGDGVTAAVLAGGSSRRMGTPKAMLRVPEHGPTMLERVVCVLRRSTDQVMVVGTRDSVYPPQLANVRLVFDPGDGPVGGLIAALRVADHPRVLLTGCDLPFLSDGVVRLVIERSVELGRSVCPSIPDATGTEALQPLLAVYHREDVEEIDALFQAGERSLVGIVKALRMARLPRNDLIAIDPGLWSLFNVNTPSDLDAARRYAMLTERNDDDILE